MDDYKKLYLDLRKEYNKLLNENELLKEQIKVYKGTLNDLYDTINGIDSITEFEQNSVNEKEEL